MAYDPRLGYDPKMATKSKQGDFGTPGWAIQSNAGPQGILQSYVIHPETGQKFKLKVKNGVNYGIDPISGNEVFAGAIPSAGGGGLPMDDYVQSLIKSMAPSGKSVSGPMSYDLPGVYSKLMSDSSDYGEKYFQDLISRIGAPSSVDTVQKSLETEGVQQLMDEIDRMTRGAAATTKLDFMDRGLGGPGQMGDIEANALAQLRAGGERTKAGAKLSAYQSELARQKAREESVSAAYGKRYEVGSAQDIQSRNLMAQLLGEEYKGGVTQREGMLGRESSEKMNYFNQILDYAMKSGALSQDDAQFYAKLISGEQQAAADRKAQYDRALLGTRNNKEKDWVDYLQQGASIAKDVTQTYRGY